MISSLGYQFFEASHRVVKLFIKSDEKWLRLKISYLTLVVNEFSPRKERNLNDVCQLFL